jgi:hypothetical protein
VGTKPSHICNNTRNRTHTKNHSNQKTLVNSLAEETSRRPQYALATEP